MRNLSDQYLVWLKELIHADCEYCDYDDLIDRLWKTPFYATNVYDENRVSDGIDFRRYMFWAYDCTWAYDEEKEGLHERPCSVLELMCALADKASQFMSNYEDRRYLWFWEMVDALGLKKFTDGSWDPYDPYSVVDEILYKFIHGYYEPNGQGSLFLIRDPSYDCRDHELWDQMHKWVSENYDYYNEEEEL